MEDSGDDHYLQFSFKFKKKNLKSVHMTSVYLYRMQNFSLLVSVTLESYLGWQHFKECSNNEGVTKQSFLGLGIKWTIQKNNVKNT